MSKPNPIAIIALCVVAVSVLAFTINDGLKNRAKTSGSTSVTSQNPISSSPFVAYNPPHGKPGHRHDLPDGAPLPGVVPNQTLPATNNLTLSNNQVAQPAATNDGVALNPAHGQPGHRCEIAVGAPLNSAPAAVSTTPTVASPTAAPASGKNPEHGQPGHRCDIAVGAPLNSAPAPTTASPAAVSTTAASTPKAAPGMNPAHGQPGHRCDIAVGAPLNSAPTTTTSTSAASNSTTPQLFPNYNFPSKESPVITPKVKSDSASGATTPAQ